MSKEPVRPAVWAVTIAVAFSYMGVGVVDPILPEISSALKASPGQTELLFSTYLFVSAALMFFASWVATRIGRKKTLLVGLAIIVTFAAACALSGHVDLHAARQSNHSVPSSIRGCRSSCWRHWSTTMATSPCWRTRPFQ